MRPILIRKKRIKRLDINDGQNIRETLPTNKEATR